VNSVGGDVGQVDGSLLSIRHTMSKVAVDKWRVFTGIRFFIRHIFGVFVARVRRGLGVNLPEKLCTLAAQ
jgi:hypothetical protein